MKDHTRLVSLLVLITFTICLSTIFVVNDIINNNSNVVKLFKNELSIGKRYTYCDGLRHLVNYHNVKIDLTECKDKPLTDMQKNNDIPH